MRDLMRVISSSGVEIPADEVQSVTKDGFRATASRTRGLRDIDLLSDSLACRTLEIDTVEFNSNVFSLTSSMNGNYDEYAMIAVWSEFEMPSGPVNEAEKPSVSVGGVSKPRLEEAWLTAMKEELLYIV